jgi:hypothetical protein
MIRSQGMGAGMGKSMYGQRSNGINIKVLIYGRRIKAKRIETKRG